MRPGALGFLFLFLPHTRPPVRTATAPSGSLPTPLPAPGSAHTPPRLCLHRPVQNPTPRLGPWSWEPLNQREGIRDALKETRGDPAVRRQNASRVHPPR